MLLVLHTYEAHPGIIVRLAFLAKDKKSLLYELLDLTQVYKIIDKS